MSSADRITVRIPTTSGDAIEAWVYVPEGRALHPAIVMAHGIGGIKARGLAPFAARFRAERARSLLSFSWRRPVRRAASVRVPLLLVVPGEVEFS